MTYEEFYKEQYPVLLKAEEQLKNLKAVLGNISFTLLMREDGTILHRQFTGWEFDPKPALEIIQNDLKREDESFNDFLKGFKEGL